MSKFLFNYVKFCVTFMVVLNKYSFRKRNFRKTQWLCDSQIYSAEYTYIDRKDCIASLMCKIFYNEESPFETEFYTFITKYLEPSNLVKQLYYNSHRSNGEVEEETFVFADGSVLDIYRDASGYWEPVVRTRNGKTFFFNPNKEIKEESEADWWWRTH